MSGGKDSFRIAALRSASLSANVSISDGIPEDQGRALASAALQRGLAERGLHVAKQKLKPACVPSDFTFTVESGSEVRTPHSTVALTEESSQSIFLLPRIC